ncbi:MAG: hypothetical protein V1726_07090 [Methanobacteriota archaeon]
MLHKKISTDTLSKNSRKKPKREPIVSTSFLVRWCRVLRRVLFTWLYHGRRKARNSITFKMLRNKKIPLYQVPLATVKVTLHALKWIFLLVLLYLAIGVIILLVQDGMRSLRDIIVYGVMGFVTFFMGYFGWYFARDVIQVVSRRKVHNEDPEL